MEKFKLVSLFIAVWVAFQSPAQTKPDNLYGGLKFRNIGPAFTSGRISDIAIHPVRENIWYVATGAAGVWKTENAGITWQPVFEHQGSYSIGCVSIDPSNPHTIWVGTGENNGGRHVGFGDGIYVSRDDGMTWQNTGLQHSEHISKIIIHPSDSRIIWVAAQGPLWNKGGERGVYKSTDGGKTWKRTLYVNEWTGATDLVADPVNPNILYAATWQRHRTVASYLGGGPGSGIYKSTDGGEHWEKLTRGLPTSRLGKIGLAVSPFHHDMIFAAVETDRRTGGFYLSRNGGMSWTKQSDIVGKGTGPHYYQEIFASPHKDGLVYFCSNYSKYTEDFGKSFKPLNEKNKHVDTHAVAFMQRDPDFVLFGTDGGLYETRDMTQTWRHFDNLPLTQFYKIAVDDAKPFYNIYGGTQDNGTQGTPSRTTHSDGIDAADWFKILDADGCQTAVEPGNPDVVYGEFQEGAVWRVDRKTREAVYIQPQAKQNEAYERWNWNAPFFISPHNPKRLYIASQRLWKSDNRGDDWEAVSPDLTRNTERFTLPVMGKVQSWDNCWDYVAMSNYNTISAIGESPVREGLLYAGTDDGYLQVSADGGAHWQAFSTGDIAGVPASCYVNYILPDRFDANIAYACLDNHKTGDFKPYLIKSEDRGKSWKLLKTDLPDRLIIWSMVQDHVDKNLFFIATEFGIYYSRNAGKNWIKLDGGLPVIPFRDITIQREEDDLVCSSFSRGIYILDDISPLRNFQPGSIRHPVLFPVKKSYLYIPESASYGSGDNHFKGQNPPFGAVFTYFLPEKYKTLKEIRTEKEQKITGDIPFPGWDALEKEWNEEQPAVIFVVKDENGNTVNLVKGPANKGFNRINWNLDYADTSGEMLRKKTKTGNYAPTRLWVTPGTYSVTMALWKDSTYHKLDGPRTFEVVPLVKPAIEPVSPEIKEHFLHDFLTFKRDYKMVQTHLKKYLQTADALQRAYFKGRKQMEQTGSNISSLREDLLEIQRQLYDYNTKKSMEDHPAPAPVMALNIGRMALHSSTYGPTPHHRKVLEDGIRALSEIQTRLKVIGDKTIPAIKKELKQSGAPVIIE